MGRRRACLRCQGKLGPANRSGVCTRCQNWTRAICSICGKVSPDVRGRKCRACMDATNLFRAVWASHDTGCETQLPSEEIERRIQAYRERADQGLDLFTGGVVIHDRN